MKQLAHNKCRKILSYSLFGYDTISENRWWDIYKSDCNRYYYNIPFLLIQSDHLFLDYDINIYYNNIGEDFLNLLQYICSVNNKIRLIFVDIQIPKTMTNTMTRYIPLFDHTCSLLFPRDLDSVISREEKRCYNIFETTSFDIMTIRSHTSHNHICCKMLAGMSGFKPSQIKLGKPEMDIFYNKIDTYAGWSCDQDYIIDTFINENYINTMIDFMIHEQFEPSKTDCYSIRVDNCEISDISFDIIEKYDLCRWAGIPCDSRRCPLIELCKSFNSEFSNLIISYIENHKFLKSFYL